MRPGRRLATVFLLALFALPLTASAQDDDHCPPGVQPHYVHGFAALSGELGPRMGTPITCEFPDPNGTGDVHQVTSEGLSFWRKSTNTPTFTNGWEHWALASTGLVYWTGDSIDPPGVAQPGSTSAGDAEFWRDALRSAPLAIPSQSTPPGARLITEFPAPIMMPRRGDPLLGDIPITGAASWRVYPYEFDPPARNAVARPWYTIYLGRVAPSGFPQSVLRGWVGSEAYAAAVTPTGCVYNPAAQYCAGLSGIVIEGVEQGYETFFGLLVNGHPAVAWQSFSQINWPDSWSVTWYDDNVDVTYEVMVTGCFYGECDDASLMGPFVGSALSPANRPVAEALAQLAATFIPVSMHNR